jgi:hypothetical protein
MYSPFTDGSDLTPHCRRNMFAFSPKSIKMKADLKGEWSPCFGLKYTELGARSSKSFSVLTGMKAVDARRSSDPVGAKPSLVARYCT